LGITVAYFTSEDAIREWKRNTEHLAAQRIGKERWYAHYQVRVAKVERTYCGPRHKPTGRSVESDRKLQDDDKSATWLRRSKRSDSARLEYGHEMWRRIHHRRRRHPN
jgi:hypothetical protein